MLIYFGKIQFSVFYWFSRIPQSVLELKKSSRIPQKTHEKKCINNLNSMNQSNYIDQFKSHESELYESI